MLSGLKILAATACAALLATDASATTDAQGTVEEIKNCARMVDTVSRVACYEDLGKRLLAAEAPAEPAPVEAAVVVESAAEAVRQAQAESAAAAVATEAIPSDLGQAKKEEKKSKEKPPVYHGRMVSCRENSDGIWYFTLDNGQVWNQSSRGYHSFEQCSAEVSITKDFFGYKMTIAGGKTLRVRRYR